MKPTSCLLAAAIASALATSAHAQVFLNEVFYDATGTDGGKTFIEIYGPPGLDISGYQILSIEGSPNTTPGLTCGNVNQTGPITLPPGSIIQPDGFFVVADAEAGITQVVCAPTHNNGQPDYIVENADFENGPDESVELVAGFSVIDALQVTGPTPPTCTIDVNGQPMGFGTPAPDVFGGFSLERYPAGSNTANNIVDFGVQGRPSPGSSRLPGALVFDVGTINATNGGGTNLSVSFANSANRPYLVVASVTAPVGSYPLGVPYDAITDVFFQLSAIPNPLVVNFAGYLDASGKATATFSVPAGLVSLPGTIEFYFCAIMPVTLNNNQTNVANIHFTP